VRFDAEPDTIPSVFSRERTEVLKSRFTGFGLSSRPPVWRPRLSFVFLAASLLVGGLSVRAGGNDGGRILAPEAGVTLVAGESVEIRWSPLPDDVEEMELLLLIDGTDTFALRLTPQVDPRTGSFRWDVPRVAAAAARLRIRYGRDGREIEGEPGAPFSIFVPPSLREAPFFRRDGECWVAPDDCLPPPASGVFGAETIDAGHEGDGLAVLPSSGERLHAYALSSRPAVAVRCNVDRAPAFGPKVRAAPPGITPARE
jgi:hypothetical protein